MKLLILIGTRPQYIKLAALNIALEGENLESVVVDSGQHYDENLSQIFLDKLIIPKPKYNIAVGSLSHTQMTAKIMIELEDIIREENPDMIVVFGDTNTTLAGSLVAAKKKIKLAHIEAGIRMQPKDMPEEINRVVTDHLATKLFCSSQRGVDNLKKENITDDVYNVGDLHLDLYKTMQPTLSKSYLSKYNLTNNNYIVVTIHRDYNVDNKQNLETILSQLNDITENLDVLLILHPRTAKMITEYDLKHLTNKLNVIEPIGYIELMSLIEHCKYVITDSGGLQKEAYFAQKRALVVMPDPAWHELVDNGWNILSDPGDITRKSKMINHPQKYNAEVYGDGNASRKIINELVK